MVTATLTVNDDRRLLARIDQELARRHLADFIELASRGYWQRAAHLDLMCEKLEGVERGEIKRLMLLVPHRYSKSETASRFFPAWFLGRNPERELLLTSYGADLAKDLSRIARAAFFALLGLIGFGIVLMFVSIPGGDVIYAVVGLVIFALFRRRKWI